MEPHRRTYGHERAQIVAEGVASKTNGTAPEGDKALDGGQVAEGTVTAGRRGWIITFQLPNIFRVIGISCIVSVPEKLVDGAKAPVYVRFRIDWDQEDRPGHVTVR